ncbi:MAG: DUF4203 domain-containing protein [Lacunisphaera sp.]|nr:DUF4203 domain-containing protein [Lacunisphaera sp.]
MPTRAGRASLRAVQFDPELYPWISVASIAWGVLDCFFGYKVFKITLALLGGLLGAAVAHVAATAAGLGPGGMTAGLLVGGLLGAGLAFLLYIAAVFVAGFGFGSTLGILLLSNFHPMVALLSGLVLGVCGGFLAVKLQRVLLMLSTALLGAFRCVVALAYFTHSIDWLFYFRQPDQLPTLIASNAWMLPAILALAAIGLMVQFGLGGNKGQKKAPAKDE